MLRSGRAGFLGSETLLSVGPLERGVFLERVNRFVVRFRRSGREELAHLPNPGRLGEILLPGTELLLERLPTGHLAWKAVGAAWSERWPGDRPHVVCLDTSRTNRLAERLIEKRLIPELRAYRIERREVTVGDSRLDFELSSGHRRFLLEVKSVTLAERGLAFFPDARTERGRRHLLALARHRDREPGCRVGVLFLVQGEADRFLPDFHNDLEFARAFRAVRRRVLLAAYRLDPTLDDGGRLSFIGRPDRLRIPWRALDTGVRDAGLYLLVLEVPADVPVEMGRSGTRMLSRGCYVYTGSARHGLSRRVARHLQTRKRLHWHVDFLRAASVRTQALPIRAASGECELAAAVARLGGTLVGGFGSSDCRCPGHLVRFSEHPVHTAAFQELLTRMRHALPLGRSRNRVSAGLRADRLALDPVLPAGHDRSHGDHVVSGDYRPDLRPRSRLKAWAQDPITSVLEPQALRPPEGQLAATSGAGHPAAPCAPAARWPEHGRLRSRSWSSEPVSPCSC